MAYHGLAGEGARQEKEGAIYLIKDILQLVLRQSRTFDIFDGSELLRHPVTVFFANGLHLLPGELLADARVIAQIGLGADDEAGNTGAVVMNFGEPLLANVLERGRRRHGEADEENVGLGVGQRAQTIVIFLTGGIEEAQGIWFVTDPIRADAVSPNARACEIVLFLERGPGEGDEAWILPGPEEAAGRNLHHSHGVVVEDGRDIFRGELVGCVRDEQAGLSYSTVPHHDTPGKG